LEEYWSIMGSSELKMRTKKFALAIIALANGLDKSISASKVIGNQLLRSGTSVGSNYRAACRAKSDADYAYKIKVVEEESDESEFWLELLIESGCIKYEDHQALLKEAGELTAIFSSISLKLKAKKK
jgi:four helix bundle protein